jgi:hypothetical protein
MHHIMPDLMAHQTYLMLAPFMNGQIKLREPGMKIHVRHFSRCRLEFLDHNTLLQPIFLTELHPAVNPHMIGLIHIKARMSQTIGHFSIIGQK